MFPTLKIIPCSLAATAVLLTAPVLAGAAPIPEDCKIGGFALGCQAYTFNRFSVFEAIEKTAQAGGKVIEPEQVETVRKFHHQNLAHQNDTSERFAEPAS